MASANATLTELARNDGAALAHANAMGRQLMDGIREIAQRKDVPVTVSGFGAAFAIHFRQAGELSEYRDTFADDAARLRTFVYRALEQGVHMVPDGRMYVSAAHTQRDIDETLERLDAAFSCLI
jgi:glutamate-1-semialdehyde 2,1-aminomutase